MKQLELFERRIHYRTTDEGFCLDNCKYYKPKNNDVKIVQIAGIGSYRCTKCNFFINRDLNKNIVICSYIRDN